MEQVRDERAERLIADCAGLSRDERDAFLQRECSGDAGLRSLVEAALAERRNDSERTQVFVNDYESSLPPHYKLIRMLGRGGMAEVFLAEDTRLGRNVAIKFLTSEFRRNHDRMRRFNQEARAASALNHPNIIVIYDIGESEGVQYIVSEYVEGETLSSRIARGRLGIAEAVSVAVQVASALAATHKAGIVHRDLKPDNVMIRADGTVKVLDFGLAKETGSGAHNSADLDARTLDKVSTAAGMILGTPQYMSPEQARGLVLDPRTDIFSLGILLFEMVTGSPPFVGNSMADTIAAIVSQEPRRLEQFLPDPPLTLIRIVEKSLRKNRDERYGTMEHMISDLNDLRHELDDPTFRDRDTGGTQARPTVHNTIRTVAARFVHWDALLVAAAIILATAAGLWWVFNRPGASDSPAPGSMRTVAITSWDSGPGDAVGGASFSPNGEMIAFAATRGGATEIWIKPVSGGDAVQVTKSGFYNQYPIWSPDGREIAFFSSRGNDRGIWRTSFTGGEQTLILGNVGGSAKPLNWTPDGSIFYQEAGELFVIDGVAGPTTSEQKRATRWMDPSDISRKPRAAAPSPDRLRIAYSFYDGDLWKLVVGRHDGAERIVLATSPQQIDYIKWRPDGNSLIYSAVVEGLFQLFQVPTSGGESIQISNGNQDFFIQDVSADGNRLLYSSVKETSDLWIATAAGGAERIVANDVPAEFWADVSPDGKSVAYQSVKVFDRPFSGAVYVRTLETTAPPVLISNSGFSPKWSPNGTWIAFFKRGPSGIEIWRARNNGSDAVKLADAPSDAPNYTAVPYLMFGVNHFSWSPASDRLAYSAPRDGVSNIWTVSSDGAETEKITSNTNPKETVSSPTWGPDGKTLTLVSELQVSDEPRRRSYKLVTMDPSTRESRIILESDDRFRFLGLSPDGKSAYLTQRSDLTDLAQPPGSTNVISVELNSGRRQTIMRLSAAYSNNIHLSRDGRSIAFVSKKDDTTAVWLSGLYGGASRKIFEERDPKILITSLAWAPDGNSVVFGKQTRTSLLSMLVK